MGCSASKAPAVFDLAKEAAKQIQDGGSL